jgi:hypothetical protein
LYTAMPSKSYTVTMADDSVAVKVMQNVQRTVSDTARKVSFQGVKPTLSDRVSVRRRTYGSEEILVSTII